MSAALAIPPPEREGFLRREAHGDQEVFDQAHRMMQESDPDTTEIIGPSSGNRESFDEAYLADRRRIGKYRLIRPIGQGGMGMVYEARLVAEDIQQQVALKLVKPSLVSPEIVRRFRMERQVLASLNHPNIARLLDAGATDEGAPYLVMEFVEGLPIDRYCEGKSLSIHERLQLFITVCSAVQYAHQNLIIHRDIKPSNILVSSDGNPKLLDFGIAKLIRPEDSPAESDLALTAMDSRPMSPHYASPEQARGGQITTASDVYSLGVLLYELLTGRLPYQFTGRSAIEIERTICESQPLPPSSVAYPGTQASTAEKTRRLLRDDLDCILLMALRKEPERRYSSVQHFSEDIRRHLQGLPVSAQRDTFRYRASKFVRRHTAGVAAAAVVVTALVSATIVSVHYAQEATREKRVAVERFQDTRALALFFITDFDDRINMSPTDARRGLVSEGVKYLRRLASEAQNDPKLLREVIGGYLKMGDIQGNPFGANLGDRNAALESYREALMLAESYRGNEDFSKEIQQAQVRLADLQVYRENASALRTYEAVLPKLTEVEQAHLLIRTGFVHQQLGNPRDALRDFNRSVAILRAALPSDPTNRSLRSTYASALRGSGQLLAAFDDRTSIQGAITTLEEALAIYKDLGMRSLQLKCSVLLADALTKARQDTEAVALNRDNIATAEALSREDPQNRQTRRDFIVALNRQIDFLAARNIHRSEQHILTVRALQELRPLIEKDPGTWELHMAVWTLLHTPFHDLRRPAEAVNYAKKWMELTEGTDPQALSIAASAYFAVGDSKNAADLARKALSLIPADSLNTELAREIRGNMKRFGSAVAPPAQHQNN